jgi:phosphoribosylamine--glycine ligase
LRLLIIGSGGREHALAWKLAQSHQVSEIHMAPGNGATAGGNWSKPILNVPVAVDDIPGLIKHIQAAGIDFVVPGPELALVSGITDACAAIGVPCFGPDTLCARLEGSKIFAKEIMAESGVPTADYAVFSDHAAATAYVKAKNGPIVIKADGLAAGKGVVVAANAAEALEALDAMLLQKNIGEAASRVLLEETLNGEEVSLLAFCDGECAVPLPSAQDHKRVFDNDAGPNTGGMGAYSPAPLLPAEQGREICDLVITPILRTMKAKGHPFKGMLYAGLMFTPQGIKVLEYNTRFGDPECQPLLMRLDSDLLEIMQACVAGRLDEIQICYRPESAVCVVVSAEGYPGSYAKGMEISGLEDAEAAKNVAPGEIKVFQAGTKLENGKLLSSGGRVLGVTALGAGLREARDRAYAAIEKINMAKAHYRHDIGDKGLARS